MIVSVIIPTYNRAKFLEKAILSVFAQKQKNCGFDIELIIIDDGSTDNTKHVIKQIISNHDLDKSLINYYQFNKNGGIPRALNKGYELARGDFCAQLSSDDWWQTNKLKKQLEIMKSDSEIGLIYSDYNFIELPSYQARYCKVFNSENRKELFKRLITDCFMNFCTFMFRKEFLKEIGYYPLRPEFEWNQDLWQAFQIVLNENWKIHYMNEATAFITIHDEQASRQGHCGEGNNILLPEMIIEGKKRGFI